MQAHEQRVVEERAELDAKRARLLDFINSPAFRALAERDRTILKEQWSAMSWYSNLLAERIARFAA